jgi:cell division protein FtsI (penicillin-binding protein 3)
MAAAYAAIFNDGVYIRPTLTNASSRPERVLRSATAKTMVTMLEMGVANDLGTGKLARIAGVRVAGKTGTADLGGDRDYASFVGRVLDREPRVVVLVGLEAPAEDGTGSTAAAPVFARIARRLIGG